jgi:hypothetical protein
MGAHKQNFLIKKNHFLLIRRNFIEQPTPFEDCNIILVKTSKNDHIIQIFSISEVVIMTYYH